MEYTRNCPACQKILSYQAKASYKRAADKNGKCQSCSFKEVGSRPEIKANRKRLMQGKFKGTQNPFYGKKHSTGTKKKLSDLCKIQRERGDFDNPKTVYEWWLIKYGKEEADIRLASAKKKWSASASGKNNPMYGKPAPSGSGNGWKGWYKGHFFRSLRELFYMVNVLEKENLSWINAESRKFSIPYISFDGNERTYRADFLVENKRLVECKPIKLHNSPLTKLKAAAAEKFCQEKGWSYELIDPPALSIQEVKELYDSGSVKFMEKYEEKFKEKYL